MPKKKDVSGMSRAEKDKMFFLLIGIICGAGFGLLGNLAANYIWSILGNTGTQSQLWWETFTL